MKFYQNMSEQMAQYQKFLQEQKQQSEPKQSEKDEMLENFFPKDIRFE